ncbi:MAG: hypothetical protein ABEI57_03885 [Halapricum sp.]
MNDNDMGAMTEQQFEAELKSLLERASEADVTVQGGWDVHLDDQPIDLGVEITAIDRTGRK